MFKLRKTFLLMSCVFLFRMLNSQTSKTLYLFPGQGSDERIFSKIHFDSTYKIVNIHYPIPEKKTTLKEYARLLIDQIDTNERYSIIGVSLGGMICSELTEFMLPEKIIVISSAKCRSELPMRYRFQKHIPIYKIIPKGMIKAGAQVLQPIVEPDRKKFKTVFKSMLKGKDKTFLKRSVGMIINWDKNTYSEKIVHIHGTRDHTLPIRKLTPTIIINKGSHMMTLTRAEEIGKIVNELLNSK